MTAPRQTASRFGWAWLTLALALAAHVTDEALTGFLMRRPMPGVYSAPLLLVASAYLILMARTLCAAGRDN